MLRCTDPILFIGGDREIRGLAGTLNGVPGTLSGLPGTLSGLAGIFSKPGFNSCEWTDRTARNRHSSHTNGHK